jgi:hypothetical protein
MGPQAPSRRKEDDMEAISQEMVEQTWMEVGNLPPHDAQKQMTQVLRKQPELMQFVFELTEDLSEEAHELAFYLFFVVVKMFEKAYGDKVGVVTAESIVQSFEANQDLLERLAQVHEKFLERLSEPGLWDQPYVLRYVVEALLEAAESEEDPVPLSEEEFGFLFLVLKTVIDSLHNATSWA